MEDLDFSSDISSKIIFVRPKDLVRNQEPHLYIPTAFLGLTFAIAMSTQAAAEQHRFFAILSSHPSLRTAGGWLFESYAYVRFSNPNRNSLEAYCRDREELSSVPAPTKFISGNEDLKAITGKAPYNFYWQPREPNFKGVDAVIGDCNNVWALQFTISASHKPATEGLTSVSKIMRSNTNVQWHLVIVGPEQDKVKSARNMQELTGKWVDTPIYACELPLGKFNNHDVERFRSRLTEVSTY